MFRSVALGLAHPWAVTCHDWPVRWFFLVGGAIFLLVAVYLRARPEEVAQGVGLTFGLIGFFWIAPQLLIIAVQKRKGR
jgi:hypothetical protein